MSNLEGERSSSSMEESLLVKTSAEERGCSSSVRWGVLVQEVKRVGSISGPMVAVILSQYLVQVVSVMMVGHLGELALSSTSMAISLSGVTGFSVIVSPLCSSFVYLLTCVFLLCSVVL